MTQSDKPIRVLIVDDSSLIRQMLTSLLSRDPGIEIIGTANDPFQARGMIKELNPDVLTLDIEMPKMDGLSFLDKIMRLRPMPVVMVSTLTERGSQITLRALEIGAVDFVTKPTVNIREGLEAVRSDLIAKIKAAAHAKVGNRTPSPAAPAEDASGQKKMETSADYNPAGKMVALGASTGGVEAITSLVKVLPANSPPIVIAQHMPPKFTASFAQRLTDLGGIHFAEASDGAILKPGLGFIAPGGLHVEIERSAGQYKCRLRDTAPESGHKPSVDTLLRSVANSVGKSALGVILTGMGADGAKGLKEMYDVGCMTVCQDEATSLIYGMPRKAVEQGAVHKELPLSKIPNEVISHCKTRR